MSRRSRDEYAARAAREAGEASKVVPEAAAVEVVAVEEPERRPPTRPVATPQKDDRELIMEEIRKSRGEKDPDAEPAKIEAIQTPAIETPAIQTPEPAPIVAPVMVKVKVNGKEYDVAQADIDDEGGLVAYRTNRAARERLDEAKQITAVTARTQAQLAAWLQSQQPKEPQLTDDQFIASKIDNIRFGTPEESAAALRDVLARNNPRVDTQAIIQHVTNEISQKAAVDNFKKEFQDITANPLLLRLAVSLENERKPQPGQETDWAEHYRKIGNEVRSVTGRPSQPAAVSAVEITDSSSPVSDKEARKASIVNLPTAAARAALPTESKPETREESLNRMRKSRGLPTE